MEILLFILAALFILTGLLGSVLPILPGPPIGFIGLLFLHFTDKVQFSSSFLIFWGAVVIAVTVLDYYIPLWGTQKFGGTKAGKTGALIGVIVGLFFGPLGIIFGPFIGALLGELVHDKNDLNKAFKSALGSFMGFLLGTGIKLIVSGFFIFFFFKESF